MRNTIPTEKMAEALRRSHGNLKLAAQMIGCNRETIRLRTEKVKSLRDIINEEREAIIDVAESALYTKTLEGDMRAIEFTLRTIGKHRGYVEKTQNEITGKDGAALTLTVVDPRKND
jgi:hypothetical protein